MYTINKIVPVLCGILLLLPLPSISQYPNCYLKSRPPTEPLSCNVASRYRTISGRCNNLASAEWGSAGSTLRRLLPNDYGDKLGVPRGGRSPSSLPSPRWISQSNHPDTDLPDKRFTHMVMQFGQFLDHDITLSPKDESLDCCIESRHISHNCFIIDIPNQDRLFSWVNDSAVCLNLVRSQPICRSNIREQYNSLTAFIDASNVYGSEQEHSAILRTYRNGRLKRNDRTNQLPSREQLNLRADTTFLRPESPKDFIAGDTRVNEHPFLTAMHIIFMREHNRIAKKLQKYLPQHLNTDAIIYQETRRLMGAIMQNIVYGEYLPTVLGIDYMRKYDLIVSDVSKYDSTVDPSIFNAFSAAAFRFGHSTINGIFKLVSQKHAGSNRNRRRNKVERQGVTWLWRLREVFDGQSIQGSQLPVEEMIEGLLSQNPQTCDQYFTAEITDHLFQKNRVHRRFGEDLLSINIQRARDHGIPGYAAYREVCDLRPIETWNDRPDELSYSYWAQLKTVYNNVKDIDLYVGGIGENNVRGGIVGPTFACLIGEQFSRLKKGDRFFYTHEKSSVVRGLSPVAKAQVMKRSLAEVICDNTAIKELQMWVTLQPNDEYNKIESCFKKSYFNLKAIADEIARDFSNEFAPSETIRSNNVVTNLNSRQHRHANTAGSSNSGRNSHVFDISSQKAQLQNRLNNENILVSNINDCPFNAC